VVFAPFADQPVTSYTQKKKGKPKKKEYQKNIKMQKRPAVRIEY
jgi:hypothetical protein